MKETASGARLATAARKVTSSRDGYQANVVSPTKLRHRNRGIGFVDHREWGAAGTSDVAFDGWSVAAALWPVRTSQSVSEATVPAGELLLEGAREPPAPDRGAVHWRVLRDRVAEVAGPPTIRDRAAGGSRPTSRSQRSMAETGSQRRALQND